MKIHTESNYKQFRILKGNRPLVPGKVKKLIDTVKSGLNLFQYCPILVNEDMYVIDGQHRLEACKQLKFTVYYVIVPNISLVQIAQMNAVSTRWKASDFFNCFIQTGNKDYEVLKDFQTRYNLSINAACSLLMNGSAPTGGDASGTFKEGKFQVRHKEKAEKIMKAVYDYSQCVEDDKILGNRNFIRAIQILLATEPYKHKEVVDKLLSKKSKIQVKSDYKQFIFHIEELFNRGNSIRRIIYHSSKSNGGGLQK